MKILITGASGVVGPPTVRALVDLGHSVSLLARGAVDPATAAVTSAIHRGAVTDRESVDRATQGVDAVIHLAALLHAEVSAGFTHADYEKVNVEGTANVIHAAERHGVGRIVLASTINVYGEHTTDVMRETSPLRPETPYAHTKAAAEGLVRQFGERGGSAVILRLAAVYGRGMKGRYPSLVAALKQRRFIPPGNGRNLRSLIHRSDVAAGFAIAATHPSASGQIFNVSDRRAYTTREIVSAICGALHQPPPRLFLPTPVALVGAGLVDVAFRLLRRSPPLTPAMVRKYNQTIVVDSSAIERALGFTPRMTLEGGWRDAVSDLPVAE